MDPDKIVTRIPTLSVMTQRVSDGELRDILLKEGFSEEEVFLTIRGAEAYLKVTTPEINQ
jgi:hypothetical protein